MRIWLRDFWQDDRGCVAATYWLFVVSILTLGSIAGLSALHYLTDKRSDEQPPAQMR